MINDTHVMTYLAITTWFFLMVLDWFGLIPHPIMGPIVVLLYTASCIGLYLLRRGGKPLPGIVPWAGALVLVDFVCRFAGSHPVAESG